MTLNLYVNGERVDIGDDHSLQMVDSVKQADEIGSLFTAYSRPFKVPASGLNSRIFKKFENFNVVGGFDARRKHPAIIKLGGMDRYYGFIKLLSVNLKDGAADTYSLQFFGLLTALKDLMGDDLIGQLDNLDRLNHDYNEATVKLGLEKTLTDGGADGGASGEIIYPLISHTRGFQYNTTNGFYDITETGTPNANDRLKHGDLKPAIRLKTLFDEIALKYDLNFVGDFIDSDIFYDLFLWCHKSKGGLVTDDPDTNHPIYSGNINVFNLDSFTPSVVDPAPPFDPEIYDQVETGPSGRQDWDKYVTIGNGSNCYPEYIAGSENYNMMVYNFNGGQFLRYEFRIDVTQTGSPFDYSLRVFDTVTGQNFLYETGLTTDYTGSVVEIKVPRDEVRLFNFDVEIAGPALDTCDIEIYFEAFKDTSCTGELNRQWEYSKSVDGGDLITKTRVPYNLPKMKVIDLIRGVAKMFNVVPVGRTESLFSDTLVIDFRPYDEYYGEGKTIDITKFVDISSSTVQRVSPFNAIEFKYQEPSTFLTINRNNATSDEWGGLKYKQQEGGDVETIYDGGEYQVEVPFEHMQFERLLDNDTTNTFSQILYGWFVNDFKENTPEPELGKPLVFFGTNRGAVTTPLDWFSLGQSTVYNAPSNTYQVGTTPALQTIHFGEEIDEYTFEANPISLYDTFYKTFMRGVFSQHARRYVVDVWFPPSIAANYNLNDKFIINNVPFNLDKIQLDLATGRGKLELLKLTADQEIYDIAPPPPPSLTYEFEDDVNYDFEDDIDYEFNTIITEDKPSFTPNLTP